MLKKKQSKTNLLAVSPTRITLTLFSGFLHVKINTSRSRPSILPIRPSVKLKTTVSHSVIFATISCGLKSAATQGSAAGLHRVKDKNAISGGFSEPETVTPLHLLWSPKIKRFKSKPDTFNYWPRNRMNFMNELPPPVMDFDTTLSYSIYKFRLQEH